MDTLNLLYIQEGCFLAVCIIERLMHVRGTQINDHNSQSFNNVLLKYLDICSMQNFQLMCKKRAFLYSKRFHFFFSRGLNFTLQPPSFPVTRCSRS